MLSQDQRDDLLKKFILNEANKKQKEVRTNFKDDGVKLEYIRNTFANKLYERLVKKTMILSIPVPQSST